MSSLLIQKWGSIPTLEDFTRNKLFKILEGIHESSWHIISSTGIALVIITSSTVGQVMEQFWLHLLKKNIMAS